MFVQHALKLDIRLTQLDVQLQNDQLFDYQLQLPGYAASQQNTLTSITGNEYILFTLTMEDKGSQLGYSNENHNTVHVVLFALLEVCLLNHRLDHRYLDRYFTQPSSRLLHVT